MAVDSNTGSIDSSVEEVSRSGTSEPPPGWWERNRNRCSLLIVYVVSSLFYLWTVASSGYKFTFGGAQNDDYNLLTDGFLHGHLSLQLVPPAGLLALKDPYDPGQNHPWNNAIYHDLVLYHGHFFLTWGPAPALTLFLPWRILHVGAMPESFAVWIFCVAALGFSILLLKYLVDRYFPRLRTWQLVLASIALAGSDIAVFLLRSGRVYEVAVACSLCWSMAGAYFLASGGLGRRRPWRLAVGSLAIGLATAGREDYILLGLLLLLVFVLVWRRERPGPAREHPGAWLRLAAPVVGPFALVVVLLFAYNYARFGSPLQFGERYQLAGVNQEITPFYQLSYVAPGLYYYLIDPIRFSLAFPYLFLSPPPPFPFGVPKVYSPETVGGIFTTTPIVLLVFSIPFVLRRRRLPSELAWFITGLAACGAILVFTVAFSIPGSTYRYEADFASLLLFPALICWFAFSGSAHRLRRRLAKVLGSIAVLFGALVGVAVSTSGYFAYEPSAYPNLESSDPGSYWRLDRLTSPIPTFVTMLLGHPVLTTVYDPEGVSAQVGYSTIGAGNNLFFYLSPSRTSVEVVSPGSGNWLLSGGYGPGPALPKGAQVVVHYAENNTTRSFLLRPGVVSIPLHLHLGVNRVDIWATARGSAAASSGPLVQVYRLYLAR